MALVDLRSILPEGGGLPRDVWRRRHNGILLLLAANAIALFVFALVQGYGVIHSALEAGIVAVTVLLAWMSGRNHLIASVVATLGLMTASGVLVHLAHGSIEAHFHFFVMVTIIILYQEWVPFLLAIAYVVTHHALFGLISPGSVFNHPAALQNPLRWAMIHGGFILGATVAGLTVWKQNESLRKSYEEAATHLAEAETRQRDALALNDNVLQHLVIAEYAFQMGLPEKARSELQTSVQETQRIVGDLLHTSIDDLEPGDLVRSEGIPSKAAP